MTIGPAPVLAALVAVFWVGLYVVVRRNAGGRLPLLLVAAWLGAWAGDAVAGRLGVELLRIGDFHLVAASVVFLCLSVLFLATHHLLLGCSQLHFKFTTCLYLFKFFTF
jgi:hypothetical protein